MNRYSTKSYGEKAVAANTEFLETFVLPIFIIGGLLTFVFFGIQASFTPSSSDYTMKNLSYDSKSEAITSTGTVQVETATGIESSKLPDNYEIYFTPDDTEPFIIEYPEQGFITADIYLPAENSQQQIVTALQNPENNIKVSKELWESLPKTIQDDTPYQEKISPRQSRSH